MLKLACVQMRSGRKVADNIATMERMVRDAANRGARLIATPEMTSLIDRTPGAALGAAKVEGEDEALKCGRLLSAELRVWLLIGSVPIKVCGESRVANRSFLLSPAGEIAAWYDKIHMFDVQIGHGETYRESDTYAPGDRLVVADLDGAKLGLTVCYDVRFSRLYRDLAQAGADILAVPSAFTRVTGEAHWHVLLRARAIETGSFVIAPAQGGRHEDGRETFGHSLIIDPWGRILAEADHAEPGIICADLDLSQVTDARRRIPALSHDRDWRRES